MTMQDVVGWLREVENLASSVYLAAAQSDTVKPEQADFLRRLAEDEAWHYHMMGSASELFREQEHMPVSAVLVDDQTKSCVEAPLHGLLEKIKDHRATEKDILEAIVKSERSEWNDIFLYVIATCAQMSAAFQYVAATMQAHQRRIEAYIESASADPKLRDVLPSLPKIWTDRLLVVEDDAAVRQLLCRVLSIYGEVTMAEDGEAGLSVIGQRFFNVIVTDVDMPGLDGVSLLERALQKQPHLEAHFVMCTGNVTENVAKAATEHSVPVLEKPVTIASLRAAVEGILQKAM